jgi:phage repressor protein C with HTH and peptisase S24 domain
MTDEESQVYRDLMRLKPEGWTANAWAVNAGVSRTVWSDMRRHGNPSRRTLQKLLSAAGSSLAEFEALRITNHPGGQTPQSAPSLAEPRVGAWGAGNLPSLPLIATAAGGDWGTPDDQIELTELRLGEIMDQLPRPASLGGDTGAFALTIVDDSMWPRFRPGRRIAVSPKAPVAVGDDVIVTLAGEGATGRTTALIKELVRRTATDVELRQFNPDATFRVEAREIVAIHKVMGELF